METRRKKQRTKRAGIPSSKQFYYKGPASKAQIKKGKTEVRTTGSLFNVQCYYKNPQTQQQCKRRTVIGSGICWQHLRSQKKLRIKKSTVFINGASIGQGLFAVDTGDPEEVVFHKDENIVQYDGEIINEFEREDRYGDGTGPYAIGGSIHDEFEDIDTPIIDSAFYRCVAALANHKEDPGANAIYMFDEDTHIQWVQALRDIKSGEEIFCDYGPEYSLTGSLAGKHATLNAKRPPPKWFREDEEEEKEEEDEEL